MNAPFQVRLPFSILDEVELDEAPLILDLDGYEGPLHVLLALAQRQKVDLRRLSVTRLAQQYLAFVRQARGRRFVLAAEYLVMAAWLAYLKSRLLLPVAPEARGESLPAETMAAQLAFRLAKLDAMRRAAEALAAGPILGREVFARGDPQATTIVSRRRLEGDLHGLMSAYVDQRRRNANNAYAPPPPASWRLAEAREHVRRLLPALNRWTALSRVAPASEDEGPTRASYLASTLSASLELVREGCLEARQLTDFAEVYLRGCRRAA